MKTVLNYWKKIIIFIIAYFFIGGLFYLLGSWLCGININTKIINNITQVQQIVLSISQLCGTILAIYIFERFNNKKLFYKLDFLKPINILILA